MTDQLTSIALPRPAAAPDAGPLDDRLYDLVETRVRRLISDNPILATYLGIHTEDSRLGDASRDAVLAEIAADRAHLAEVEALDDAGLSPAARFERDLELHNLRLGLYEHDEIRRWERRSSSAGELGDAIFLLFARGAAPLSERLARIADRLEEAPAFLEQGKTRAVGQQVAIWQRTEARYAADLPSLFAEVRSAAEGVIDGAELEAARAAPSAAPTPRWRHTRAWIEQTIADASDDWPLGAERYDELVRLRAFGDLDSDAILQIGQDQLQANLEGRRAAGARARPRRRHADDHRAPEGRPAGHVRGGARRLPRGHGPGPRLPHRARPGHDPGRRADRGHRDPGVPALGDAVRGLLLARPLRRRPARHLRRDAGRRQRPQRDARALPGVDLQHQHPRGVPGPPPAARGRVAPSVADADAHRGARVRRGLGHVLRADDARGGLRRRSGVPRGHVHRRRVARLPDHPRRPDAPGRADARRGDRLPRRAHGVRGRERAGRGPALHVHAGLPAELPAGQGPDPRPARGRAPPARGRLLAQGRSTTRCCATARCRSASTAACCGTRA